MKNIILVTALLISLCTVGQVNQAKVYWVGHSLISATDYNSPSYKNLMLLVGDLATSQSKIYNYYKHTIPGSPLGWNWGSQQAQTLIAPLTDAANPQYGTFDVIVLTEAIELSAHHLYWNSSFFARKFYNAARLANPATRLYMYESWHPFHGTDDNARPQYGPISMFNWRNYMTLMRTEWEAIIDETSDPNLTQNHPGYTYQGTGVDPGLGNGFLDVCIIPTGQVLVDVLDRLALNLPSDNWMYNGSPLTSLDFFQNPLANFPTDTVTPVDISNQLDDIHPSNVLAYLNSLVHYAVIYRENPINLPAINGVPSNIASIFKQVVWNVVSNDPRTCVLTTSTIEFTGNEEEFNIYPNPASTSITINLLENESYQITNSVGVVVLEGKESVVDIKLLPQGIYFVKVGREVKKLIKQ